jgi:hypothetical protein
MTKRRGRLVSGVVVLAVVGTAVTVGVSRSHDGAAQVPQAHAAAVARTTAAPGKLSDAQKAVRRRQVDVVLARRATAVLKGDQKAFLSTVDPRQSALVKRQRTLFLNLRKIGFASLRYFVAEDWEAPAQIDKHGPTTFPTRVMMRYRLAKVDPRPVQTDVGYVFVRRGTRWILVEDGALDEVLGASGHQQPWDFGEIAVVRRGSLVIVVDKAEATLGRKIARTTAGAVKAVRRHWPEPWSGAVMVVAMSNPKVIAFLWEGGGVENGWTIAAKAVAQFDGDPRKAHTGRPVSSRVIINPAERKGLDEELLVHELTHVATLSIGRFTPQWLAEGTAEYVRCRSIEDDPHWTVDPYRRRVRSKYLAPMKVLPGPEEFYRHGDRSYGQSWWVVEYLVARKGIAGLAALYTDLGAHNTSRAAYAAIIKRHTGKTPQQLTAAVKKFKG